MFRSGSRRSVVLLGLVISGMAGAIAPAQVVAEWGDAPDSDLVGYPIPFQFVDSRFPTLPSTTTSRFHLPGIHMLSVIDEWLGQASTAEFGVRDCSDPDLRMNYIDNDSDDGLINPPCPLDSAVLLPPPALVPSRMTVRVQLAPTAPVGTRYLNVLIDQNNDGEWRDRTEPFVLREWVTRDHPVTIAPGTQLEYNLGLIPGTEFGLLITPTPKWIRIALTTQPVSSVFVDDGSGWDGGGEFLSGEAEDYLVSGVIAATAIAMDAQSATDTANVAVQASGVLSTSVTSMAGAVAAISISAQAAAVSAAHASAAGYAQSVAAAHAAAQASAVAATASRITAQARFDQLAALCQSCNNCSACDVNVTAAALYLAAAKSAELAAYAAVTACAQALTYAQAQVDACAVAASNIQVRAGLLAQAQAVAATSATLAIAAQATAQAHAAASASAYAEARLRACGQDISATAEASAEANAQAFATVSVLLGLSQQSNAVAGALAEAGGQQQAAIAIQAQAQSASLAALGAVAIADAGASVASFTQLSVAHSANALLYHIDAVRRLCEGACGGSATPDCPDLNGDGRVDLSDLSILLARFGSLCTP